MNYSLHVNRRSSLIDIDNLSNKSHCFDNAAEIMWAMVTSHGWSDADVKYKMIADVYVVLTLCIFGFIGNAVTIAVLRKEPERTVSSTNWLLQTLALVDTMYLAARSIISY